MNNSALVMLPALFFVTIIGFSAKLTAKEVPNSACLLRAGVKLVLMPEKDLTSQQEFNRAVEERAKLFADRPSLDTRPIIITIGKISYKIPRNYITKFAIPTIKVTYPAFRPISPENQDCFGVRQKKQCLTFEFRLNGPFISHQLILQRIMPTFRSRIPRLGPYGYQIYETGPNNARIETYTKTSQSNSILFNCTYFGDEGNKNAICDDNFDLHDGNTVQFFSYIDQIDEIPSIEARVLNLMESLRVKELK